MAAQTLCLLEDLSGPLSNALARLITRSVSAHAFIVVQISGRREMEKGFVQFCNTEKHPLIFDAPMLNRFAEPCPFDEAIERADSGLRDQGLSNQSQLEIIEDEQSDDAHGEPFWKWKSIFG